MPGRPVAAANWHITLRFVGAACPAVIDRLIFEVDRRLDDSVFDVGVRRARGVPEGTTGVGAVACSSWWREWVAPAGRCM